MAAGLQHDPPAQCLGIPAPGSRGAAALCGCCGYASATAQGWSVGMQKPNITFGTALGGRSVAIRMAVRPPFPVDLLVRTPEKIRQRLAIGDPFIREILERGKPLYEAADR